MANGGHCSAARGATTTIGPAVLWLGLGALGFGFAALPGCSCSASTNVQPKAASDGACPPGQERGPNGCVAMPAKPCAPGEVCDAYGGAVAGDDAGEGSCPSGMVFFDAQKGFQMGSGVGHADAPPHAVDVGTFCVDKTEVTVAAYGACPISKDGCAPAPSDSELCNGGRRDRQDHPINCIDASTAERYCRWAGKRLPREEEWELAARGTEGREYPWGTAAPGPHIVNACGTECRALGERLRLKWDVAFDADDGWPATAPVGSFPDGATHEGLLDMAGNVWEWTASDYPRANARVARGGSWSSDAPGRVRAVYRGPIDPSSRGSSVGFRCAFSAYRSPAVGRALSVSLPAAGGAATRLPVADARFTVVDVSVCGTCDPSVPMNAVQSADGSPACEACATKPTPKASADQVEEAGGELVLVVVTDPRSQRNDELLGGEPLTLVDTTRALRPTLAGVKLPATLVVDEQGVVRWAAEADDPATADEVVGAMRAFGASP